MEACQIHMYVPAYVPAYVQMYVETPPVDHFQTGDHPRNVAAHIRRPHRTIYSTCTYIHTYVCT